MQKQLEIQFKVPQISLATKGVPKTPHIEGIIYSTKPLKTLGKDGNDYIIKGPENNIVIAELSAYLLARHLNVPVPDFGIAHWGKDIFFASKEQKIKVIDDILSNDRLVNRSDISNIIAFDILIENPDRNMGNLVASQNEANPTESFLLYAIDFEKSRVLNPGNILSRTIGSESYWPTGDLGKKLEGVSLPLENFIRNIHGLSYQNHIFNILSENYDILKIDQGIFETIRNILFRRAEIIDSLIRRYWR